MWYHLRIRMKLKLTVFITYWCGVFATYSQSPNYFRLHYDRYQDQKSFQQHNFEYQGQDPNCDKDIHQTQLQNSDIKHQFYFPQQQTYHQVQYQSNAVEHNSRQQYVYNDNYLIKPSVSNSFVKYKIVTMPEKHHYQTPPQLEPSGNFYGYVQPQWNHENSNIRVLFNTQNRETQNNQNFFTKIKTDDNQNKIKLVYNEYPFTQNVPVKTVVRKEYHYGAESQFKPNFVIHSYTSQYNQNNHNTGVLFNNENQEKQNGGVGTVVNADKSNQKQPLYIHYPFVKHRTEYNPEEYHNTELQFKPNVNVHNDIYQPENRNADTPFNNKNNVVQKNATENSTVVNSEDKQLSNNTDKTNPITDLEQNEQVENRNSNENFESPNSATPQEVSSTTVKSEPPVQVITPTNTTTMVPTDIEIEVEVINQNNVVNLVQNNNENTTATVNTEFEQPPVIINPTSLTATPTDVEMEPELVNNEDNIDELGNTNAKKPYNNETSNTETKQLSNVKMATNATQTLPTDVDVEAQLDANKCKTNLNTDQKCLEPKVGNENKMNKLPLADLEVSALD